MFGGLALLALLFMYQFNGFRKSTPPQNRQLNVLTSRSKHEVDDVVGELTFENYSIRTFCVRNHRSQRCGDVRGAGAPRAPLQLPAVHCVLRSHLELPA